MTNRVLLADDASFMREMIREIIVPEGFEVVAEASDGIEVVEKYKEVHPDLVMMDMAGVQIPPAPLIRG